MTNLIACLGSEKGTLAHVAEIIKQGEWEKVFIITEDPIQNMFNKENIEIIRVNPNQYLHQMAEEIRNKLENKISGIEVALNIISGRGKLHMAVLSALLKMGLGIRLIALTKNGVREI